MGEITTVPAQIASLAPGFKQMGESCAQTGSAVSQVCGAAEGAASNADVANPLFEFRTRWSASFAAVAQHFADTANAINAAAQQYGVTETTNTQGFGK